MVVDFNFSLLLLVRIGVVDVVFAFDVVKIIERFAVERDAAVKGGGSALCKRENPRRFVIRTDLFVQSRSFKVRLAAVEMVDIDIIDSAAQVGVALIPYRVEEKILLAVEHIAGVILDVAVRLGGPAGKAISRDHISAVLYLLFGALAHIEGVHLPRGLGFGGRVGIKIERYADNAAIIDINVLLFLFRKL